MLKITLDKKFIVMIAVVVLVAGISFSLFGPLLSKVRRVGGEVKVLEREMLAARDAIKMQEKFQRTGSLLTRQKVSLAIDEMTKTGATLGINFLSISPQRIMKTNNSEYPVLPIQMDLRSKYENLGLFLGSLEVLKESIVTVRSFEMDSDQNDSLQIETTLVVEIHLREGEDG